MEHAATRFGHDCKRIALLGLLLATAAGSCSGSSRAQPTSRPVVLGNRGDGSVVRRSRWATTPVKTCRSSRATGSAGAPVVMVGDQHPVRPRHHRGQPSRPDHRLSPANAAAPWRDPAPAPAGEGVSTT